MRFTILASAVALSCCGLNSLASAQYSRSAGLPTPAPSLYLGQSDEPEQPQAQVENSASNSDEQANKRSPFDFLNNDAKALSAPEAASLQYDSSPSADAGTGKSVGRLNSSPADIIIAGAKAVNAGYFPPIDWASAGHRTPNPTADYMLREYCVDGLWDNYAAERAQQCARQMERIYGGHRHCGSCGVQPACQSCGVGCGTGQSRPVINRYRTNGSCTGCAQCTGQATPAAVAAPGCNDCAQATGPNGRPAPISMLPPPTMVSNPGKVASLPTQTR
ncbi:MAG: hypothetical protein U0930_23090 [Pirellulales bacterium]